VPPEALLKGYGRGLPAVAIRQLAVALTRRLTRLSLPVIARHLGLRDHTTAIHAISRMRPIMAVLELELGDEDQLERWVACALPLVFTHLGEMRGKHGEKSCWSTPGRG
jgi:hypothetical protein